MNVVLRRARTFNQLLHPHCHLHSALRKLAFSSKLDRLDSWHWGRWLIPLGIFIFHSPFLAYSIFLPLTEFTQPHSSSVDAVMVW